MLRTLLFALCLALLAIGCDTGESVPDITGDWSGTALLPNAFNARATFTQQRRTVSGTMRISGAFPETLVQGLFDDEDRLEWQVQDGCEMWSGIFEIDPTTGGLVGPIVLDGSACASPASASGTLHLTR